MNQVWELELPHEKQNILLALADHANDDGVNCFPGVDYLAWKCGYDRRSIQRILRQLEDDELIAPVAYAEGGRGRATEFKIDITKAKKKIPFEEFKRIQKAKRAAKCHPLADEPEEEKGGEMPSFPSEKSGRMPPIDEEKRAASTTQRAASDAQKGGIRAAPTIINHQEPSNTHTPRAREEVQGRGSSVCVTSDLSFDDYLRYARAQSTIHTPEGWASVHFDKRDRDILVGEWLESRKPEKIGEARAEKAEQKLTFHEAVQRVKGMPAPTDEHRRTYINTLDVSEEVREQIVEKFFPSETRETLEV